MAWLHDQGYAKTTIARRLSAVRSWCRFLCRQGVLTINPADGLRGPRQDKKLPHFLSEDDLGRLLEAPPADTPLGLRDRAILETLYSGGLRVSELTGLDLERRGPRQQHGHRPRQGQARAPGPARSAGPGSAASGWLDARGAMGDGRGRPQTAPSS